MKNRKQTSPKVAAIASQTLRDAKASKRDKTLAGCALAQTARRRRSR
ncbi:MAG: hypothetical protein ABI629_11690 [bacterium]